MAVRHAFLIPIIRSLDILPVVLLRVIHCLISGSLSVCDCRIISIKGCADTKESAVRIMNRGIQLRPCSSRSIIVRIIDRDLIVGVVVCRTIVPHVSQPQTSTIHGNRRFTHTGLGCRRQRRSTKKYSKQLDNQPHQTTTFTEHHHVSFCFDFQYHPRCTVCLAGYARQYTLHPLDQKQCAFIRMTHPHQRVAPERVLQRRPPGGTGYLHPAGALQRRAEVAASRDRVGGRCPFQANNSVPAIL